MIMLRRFLILAVVACITVPALVGQSAEMTVEEAYLQEAMELMIIRETSRSSDREQKLIALEYIGGALERGSTNEEIRTTLELLSLEGTQNQARERGRLRNDFPEVRREAARYLGIMGTSEARAALIRITTIEGEPMVLQEAVKSLGSIELEDSEGAVAAIVWVANRFNNSASPDNLLALSTVDALERIAERNSGLQDPGAFQVLVRIAEGPFISPVRERARQALINLRRYTAQGQRRQ